ncbi:MAG: hypothetical protein Q9191_003904 [Dirinaria sp. TL-2023a]
MTQAEQGDESMILSQKSEALLGRYRDEATEKTERTNQENLLPPSLPRRHQSTFRRVRRTYASVVPAVLLVIVLLTTLNANFNRPSTSSVSLTSKVYNVSAIHTDDYVLDAHWDFSAPPTRREYHWRVDDTDHNPDGVYRPMILINRQFPGPLIECNEGDTVIVHVDNRAVNATSFHWHGIYQNGTNWMDGTVGITQCPIAPGTSFTYEFVIEHQAGTYWYHANQGVQPSDGLMGPLIVHAKDERKVQKLEYATDRVVMVQDHYHNLSSALLMDYLKPDRENAEPVPDGALINGVNIRDCDKLAHKDCDNSTATRPIFDLTANENHRLRIVNTGAFAEFQIQLDEHVFAVTEVDGTDVEPVFYHRLKISPGQRYSIVVSTNVTTADSFWLRARMITACFAEENSDLEPEVRAIIHYENDNVTRGTFKVPQSKDWDETIEVECRDMNTSELVPVRRVAAPTKVDETFYIRSNFEIGARRLSRGFFNTSSWRPDVYSPSLDRVINHTTHDISFATQPTGINDRAFDLSNEMVLQIPGIQTIDLLISNFDDGNHPLHLHGYKYFVLAQGHGYFDPSMYAAIDLNNPLRRDTASVEAFGWILIRLVTDNPGIWAFHCHIGWHTEAGLMMQLLVQPEVMATWELPEGNRELCRGLGLEKGAGPKDEIWYEEES